MSEQYSMINQTEKAHLRLEITSALGSLSLETLQQIHDLIIDEGAELESVDSHDSDYDYLDELELSDPSKQPSKARVLSLDEARRRQR
jgi:hypothetical protein